MSTQSSPIAVKLSLSLYVNSRLNGSRRIFYRPVWFSTERRLHLWSFISTALRKKVISLLIPMEVEKWSCLKMKRAPKNRREVILFKRLIGPDCLIREGVFLIAFSSTNIFRLARTLEEAKTSREFDRLTMNLG